VILRCLEPEPSARPATALAVAGALPGGDPLAAALAAGETPSPQLVAASGETTGLRPGVAIACLAAVLVGLGIGTYLSVRYSAIERMHLEQSPEVLAQKARELVARLGYPEKPADTAYGFDYDTNFRTAAEHETTRPNWDELIAGRPTLLYFWYRQSPRRMSADNYQDFMLTPDIVSEEDPPTTLSGMMNLQLDPKGRLVSFQVIPPQKFTPAASTASVDWAPLFAAAEIDPSKLQPAQPEWNSLAAADTRVAWIGMWPGTSRKLRVEAAAWQGKPVFFALIGDWNKPWRMVTTRSAQESRSRAAGITALTLLISILMAGAALARRNYRHGRGDREGALRLAMVMFALGILLWLCRAHFVLGFELFGSTMLMIASGLLIAGVVWVIYMAIEPWIRRRWPHAIISWSRLIAGQVRDPLVGRDILFGVVIGALWLVIVKSTAIPLARMGAAPPFSASDYLLRGRQAMGQWLLVAPQSIFITLEFFFVLLGLKHLVEFLCGLMKVKVARSDWIAAVPFLALWITIQSLQTQHPAADVPAIVLIYVVLVVVVLRFGLLPLAIGAFTVDMLANVPFTADFSEWYATTTLLTLVSIVALAGWGFYHSLGGEPVWKVEME